MLVFVKDYNWFIIGQLKFKAKVNSGKDDPRGNTVSFKGEKSETSETRTFFAEKLRLMIVSSNDLDLSGHQRWPILRARVSSGCLP